MTYTHYKVIGMGRIKVKFLEAQTAHRGLLELKKSLWVMFKGYYFYFTFILCFMSILIIKGLSKLNISII
jgi:hypothetical protein